MLTNPRNGFTPTHPSPLEGEGEGGGGFATVPGIAQHGARGRLLAAAFLFTLWLGAQVLSAAEYAVQEGSQIVYHVSHPLHKVTGVNTLVAGVLAYEMKTPQDFAGLAGREIAVNWKDFDSGNRNRDTEVLRVVKADRYPRVVFVIDKVGELRQEGTRFNSTVTGRLYLSGRRKTLDLPVTAVMDDPQEPRIRAQFKVRLTDFGIERPSLLFLPTEDEVGIEVDLIFAQTSPPQPAN